LLLTHLGDVGTKSIALLGVLNGSHLRLCQLEVLGESGDIVDVGGGPGNGFMSESFYEGSQGVFLGEFQRCLSELARQVGIAKNRGDAGHLPIGDRPVAGLADLTEGVDDTHGRIDTLMEWVIRDEENGVGDAPWPPHYPKMPGEPPRVQPSKQRRSDDEY
jgi:hypothetical protein